MRPVNARRTFTVLTALLVLTGVFISGLVLSENVTHPAFAKDKDDDGDGGHKCTLKSAQGTYGFALPGNIAGVGVIAAGGTTTFDGAGKQTGKFTLVSLAASNQFTFDGAYTVNPDCSGTATLHVTPAVFGVNTLHLSAVGTNKNTELKWLVTDAGLLIAGTLTKQ
jgi:hypothetical protein